MKIRSWLIKNQEQARLVERQEFENKFKEFANEAKDEMLKLRNETAENVMKKTGMELHDRLSGLMVASLREMEMLKKMAKIEEEKAIEQYENTMTMLQDSLAEMRRVSHGMASLELKSGLIAAINQTAKNISKLSGSPKIEVNTFKLKEISLDAKTEQYLFRVVQESLTNILKYAKAKEVSIQLINVDNELTLDIEDDGVGFKYNPQGTKNGLGISSMESRVLELGGKFSVNSEPEKGTKIRVSIPLEDNDEITKELEA